MTVKIEMQREAKLGVAVGLILTVFMLIVGMVLGLTTITKTNTWQNQAAKTECARFHPDTGKFEWLNPDK